MGLGTEIVTVFADGLVAREMDSALGATHHRFRLGLRRGGGIAVVRAFVACQPPIHKDRETQ